MDPIKAMVMGNIQRVKSVDLSEEDFEDNNFFFIRAGTTGYLRYCPANNADDEYIEKEFAASNIFIDPEQCRKIFSSLEEGGQREMATDVYVGYGV